VAAQPLEHSNGGEREYREAFSGSGVLKEVPLECMDRRIQAMGPFGVVSGGGV